jgi:lambda family phage portal protein
MSKIRQKALASRTAQLSRAKSTRQVAARAALRYFGGGGAHNGARIDRPALKNWTPLPGGPNVESLPDLDALRGRSEDLIRNAPIATGVLATNVTSTVGTGIVPHSRIDREFLGLDDAAADKWEADAERVWAWWAESTACDLAGRMDFYAMQGLALRSQLARGDLFGIKRYEERAGDLLGTRIQLIEADRVSTPLGQMERDGFLAGIEFDPVTGRQIRIHITEAHPGEMLFGFRLGASPSPYKWIPEEIYGPETGSRRVLQIMDPTRLNQVRGVPYLAPVMEHLKQLDRYTEAEVMAAVVNSFLTVFIKSDNQDEDLLPDMGDETTLANTRALPGAQNDVRLGVGSVIGLQAGESIEQTKVSRPNPQFDLFILAVLRQVGVALEVPFELLVKHFTASYSASRAAMLEAWRSTMRRRGWLVSSFCQPIYEWVIEEAVARGILDAPGFFDAPLVRRAYLTAEWMGTAMGSLDPESDVKAAEARVALGVSTLAEETAQMTGGDWQQKHRQRVKEVNARRRDGLDVAPVGAPTVRETTAEVDGEAPIAPVPAKAADPATAKRSKSSPARAARAEMRAERELTHV